MKVEITVDVCDDDCVTTEQTFIITMRWDKAPDTGWGWWLESVEPTPPNEYVEERLMEIAVQRLREEEAAMRESW